MAFEKSVGAVVFRREKNKILYLLIRHPQSDGYCGHWDLPKGHTEKGETNQETLRREVKEETGITELEIVPNFSQWYGYFYRAKDREKAERKSSGRGINIFKIVKVYLVETKEKAIKLSSEHIDYSWMEYNEAFSRITYKNPKKTLEKAHKFLIKHKIIN
jgi:bis(5'-nucleosidyl)-tetraphosphatase